MRIQLTADSTCDLPKDILNSLNIKIMPLIVNLDERSFYDDGQINNNDIFKFVEQTGHLPKTAARSIYEYMEFFKNALENSDVVLHISLSSEVSCSYDNARQAAAELENVIVIDSRSLSTGYGLLILKAADLINEGKAIEDIKTEIINTIPKVRASFILDTLRYLYKSGRCSAIVAFGANLLKIKPCIKVTNGEMGVTKKYMGKLNEVITKYIQDILSEDIDKSRAFITYSSKDHLDIEKFKQILKSKGFENIIESEAGCTITSHCGPSTLGVLFLVK